MAYLWVAIGGALGSIARYGCSVWVMRVSGALFPLGTLLVNVSGAIVIGFFAAFGMPGGRLLLPVPGRLFVMTGMCGGYTTFSTFSLETLTLMRDGDWTRATANIVLSVALCLIAAWAGFAAGMSLNRARA